MGRKSNQFRFYKIKCIVAAVIVSLAWLIAVMPNNARAAIITSRILTLDNSIGGASTSYTLSFNYLSTTTILSVEAVICTTAEGACSIPTGFSVSSGPATLDAQPSGLGDVSGWTIDTTTVNKLRIKNATNSSSPGGAASMKFNGVKNPDANDADNFFARITTYSDDAWATPIDTGTVSASIADQDTVTVDIGEVLTFTLDTTTVNLGPLTADVTGTGTSTLTASTNATNGYSVTVSGNTLESGVNSITALAAQTASTTGTAQFGINLVNNATPNVGADPSGGSGAGTNDYNDADLFRFVSGDSIASTAGPSNTTTFTVSYIANVATTTAIGDYSTTLTYIVTGNF